MDNLAHLLEQTFEPEEFMQLGPEIALSATKGMGTLRHTTSASAAS